MSSAGLFAALLAAFVAGAFTWGPVVVAKERLRRILRDWKTGRKGQRTLRRMGRRVAGQLARAVLVLVLAVGVIVWLVVRSTS